MATENLIPELSWLCAFLFIFIVVMLIVNCVCLKEKEKPQEYGTAGRLSITRDSPILHFQPRNGGTLSISSRHSDLSSDDGNPKRNSWTVKDRALPEIPDIVTVTTNQSGLENGITITNEQVKVKSRNKAMAPKPPGSDTSKVFPVNGSALLSSEGTPGLTVTITVNDKTQIIGNNASGLDLGSKPRIPVNSSVPGTSSSNMVVLKKVEKKESTEAVGETSSALTNVYDVVGDNTADRNSHLSSISSSPVCIHVENSANTAPEDEHISSPSASLAVAGAVPSSDIPYMTPPLLHDHPTSSYDMSEENNNAGGQSEVPYTVISVREPLARVREITMRKQKAAAMQQNSEESEDHYAMVPEEEQMYAEIGSGHESGSSSITYAHIEPRELPPVPPTVESLKSVAHAHSRQASTVSTCSFTSNVSSSGEPASPSILGNPSTSLYSAVEKSANKQRKTIHLGEGVSLAAASTEKKKKVEDLYAKVRKKRVDLSISTSACEDYSAYQGVHGENVECITPPPSPWASTTPPAPPPIAGRLQAATLSVLLPGGSHHIRRHSADPNLPEVINDNRVFGSSARSSAVISNVSAEPDYERIYNEENNSGDSCYEKIKDEVVDDDPQGSAHPSDAVASESGYPGYEIVKDVDEESADPGYECVNRENDPGYEPVRVVGSFDDSDSNSDYTVVKLDEVREPGYEVVKNLARSGSDAADPGYEKIKKVPRTDSDATDPGYERVKNKVTDTADPGYETVQRSDSDTDPCYEIVHGNSIPTVEYGGPASSVSSSANHNSNSTILFVSGSSQVHSHHKDLQNNIHDILNESSATFL